MARLDDSLWLAVWMCMHSGYQVRICVSMLLVCMSILYKLKSCTDEFTDDFQHCHICLSVRRFAKLQ